MQQFDYQTTPSPFRSDASATVEATVSFTPEMRKIWQHNGATDRILDAYLQIAAAALRNDVANSGLFTRTLEPGAGKPDYLVRIQAEEHDPADVHLRMTIHLLDGASGGELFTRTADVPLGIGFTGPKERYVPTKVRPLNFPPDMPNSGYSGLNLMTGTLRDAVQQAMPVMKSGVGQFLQAGQEKLVARQMETASLTELIVATDPSANLARARNRAIVTTKNQQLPAILHSSKTEELSALVIKIELSILDLNHEGELAKDRAQQATAANADQSQTDELRGLSLSFRERIELLKPILAALKEEIANRNR